jgi:hypothetical protein
LAFFFFRLLSHGPWQKERTFRAGNLTMAQGTAQQNLTKGWMAQGTAPRAEAKTSRGCSCTGFLPAVGPRRSAVDGSPWHWAGRPQSHHTHDTCHSTKAPINHKTNLLSF